jgi:hypothetical protein
VSYLCVTGCGRTVQGEDRPCIFCYFTGRYFTDVLMSQERSAMLTRIREIPEVERAEVWHQGNGSFSLCVALSDGRMIFPGVRMAGYTIKEGEEPEMVVGVIPMIPPVDGLWGIAVARQEDVESDITFMEGEFTDAQVVETIAQMASFNAMLDT